PRIPGLEWPNRESPVSAARGRIGFTESLPGRSGRRGREIGGDARKQRESAAGYPAARLYNESEMAVQKERELRFGKGADLGVDDRAVAKQHQRGDAPDAVLGRHRLVFVDVDLHHL